MVIDDVTQYVIDLEDLVRWLAIPYGDNDPVLALSDQFGHAHPDNARLFNTWCYVLKRRHHEEVSHGGGSNGEEGGQGNDVN